MTARLFTAGLACFVAGALANVFKDWAKAEALFARAMKESPREFRHWVGAGGSYLGVRPQ